MKKIMLFAFLLITISCSNNRKMEETMTINDAESAPAIETLDQTARIALDYNFLAKQKFQDYLDLLTLQIAHPEFNESTEVLLNKIAPNALTIPASEEITLQKFDVIPPESTIAKENISLLFEYEIQTPQGTYLDTIVGDFKRTQIVLDDKTTTNTQLTLHNYNKQKNVP